MPRILDFNAWSSWESQSQLVSSTRFGVIGDVSLLHTHGTHGRTLHLRPYQERRSKEGLSQLKQSKIVPALMCDDS